MQSDRTLEAAYRALEDRMRELAEADGHVFLPNPEPDSPVHYVLICMEPSLGRWARSADEATSKVEAGFRNFLFSIDDFILHFCAHRYLCAPAERYHITDLSKGAMLTKRAGSSRYERYDRWYALLEEELDLIATPNAGIVAVGTVVGDYLKRKPFKRSFTKVIHYSPQAARARNKGIEGREDRFRAFRDSVALEDLIATAEDVLTASRVPADLRDETLSRLARTPLTTSRQKLIFNYKISFESMQS